MFKFITTLFPAFCTAATLSGSFYDYQIPGLDLQERPKALILVNIASQCGLVRQLNDLETLYQRYKNQGLLIVGVPSADFLRQEPLASDDIPRYCHLHYGVTFPIVQKTSVKGSQALEIYQWLSQVSSPKWNYHKYIFDAQGHYQDYFWPTTSPLSEKFEKKIQEILNS